MFYSQLLLSKKGALGIVWLAAHCHRRLNKDQVQQTNISSSVDKILYDEVPVVTHRILAFLLLGVVRIYSKKVGYLFDDCNEVLNKLCGLKTVKDKRARIGPSQTRYYSITLPKRFELDAFDLDLENQDLVGGNVRLHERDMREGITEKMPFSEAYTPPRDVLLSHHVNQDSFVGSTCNMNISFSSMEALRGARFSLEDLVEPIALDEAEDSQLHDKLSNKDITTSIPEKTNDMVSDSFASLPSDSKPDLAPSLERLRENLFTLEDRLDPMVMSELETEDISPRFCGPVQNPANISPQRTDSIASLGTVHKDSFKMLDEAEKRQVNNGPSEKQHEVVIEDNNCESQSYFQEGEPPGSLTGSVDKPQPTGLNKLKSLEVVTPESMTSQKRKEFPMSIVTPDPKLPQIGSSKPEVATVQTPARKECPKILKRKSKILFDETIVVSNTVFRSWIDDPTDLKRQKKDSPHTLLHAWRARKLASITQSFVEPSIPVISADLCDLERKWSNFAAIKLVELSMDQDECIKSPVAHVDCEQVGGDVIISQEQPPIAPGTPVTHLKSVRSSHEAGADADSNILEPTSSSESVEKIPYANQMLEADFEFQEDTSSFQGDNQGEGKCTYSARTRVVGSYLTKIFLSKRKHEKQVLNLSQLLARKTKRESSRLFYEMLVLKTQGCIDVEQEKPYGDILVRETCKLKQASQA
ncbi:sister chromatid cohesion 1 protein [Striga asiatica]|uniref:Sister chromatid cohesion 1 protein n=1 Tax=Striga asiatica TaxID=4170 RepID=A0A5A7PKX5_STRAF|nr:sister chromatid cohesion 1 protein [Striga asiatica]